MDTNLGSWPDHCVVHFVTRELWCCNIVNNTVGGGLFFRIGSLYSASSNLEKKKNVLLIDISSYCT